MRASRQAGWLHFRPDLRNKSLRPVSNDAWARNLPEGSDRVGADFLRLRDAWYQDGQILPFTDKELQDPNLAAGFQTEAQYLINEIDKTYNGLEIEMAAGFAVDETERVLFDSVFQHPSLRAPDDPDWQKQIEDTVTQLPKKVSNLSKQSEKKKKEKVSQRVGDRMAKSSWHQNSSSSS
jgi:hypothetical protein